MPKPLILCFTVLQETSPQALPLGGACIASALRTNKRIQQLFDIQLKSLSLEDSNASKDNIYLSLERLFEAEVFAFCASVYVWNRDIIESIVSSLKLKYPSVIFIAGGPEVTASPLSFNTFDYTVVGEGECSVPSLIEVLYKNSSLSLDSFNNNHTAQPDPFGYALGIQGVYDIKSCEKNVTKTSQPAIVRSVLPDLEKISSPYLDRTLDIRSYGGALWELARGCPFKCSYCYESKGEKKIRYFPLERIKEELAFFKRENISQVFVLDPTYNADKNRALYIIDLIRKTASDIYFYFEVRAEYIDMTLAKAFASITCSLQIGLQSSNADVLKNVHRSFNKKIFSKNVSYLNEAGAIFGFDLIYGLPGDCYKGFCESIDYALSLYPNNLELFCLSVLPGTLLYEEATSLGLKWQKDAPYHVTESNTFSASDIKKASLLSEATYLFYTRGRAVSWFNALIKPLRIKPSAFFENFVLFLQKQNNKEKSCDDFYIELLQKSFISMQYKKRGLEKFLSCAEDLISMNAALGRCTSTGAEETIKLHYHPDDLMSIYAQDIAFFVKNFRPIPCSAKVFVSIHGVDWKKI